MKYMSIFTVIILVIILCTNTFAVQRSFNIDDIRKFSDENSEGKQNTSIDIVKKQIELKQAKEGIEDIRKKESTIRFSLLFSIKFPEKHGMPKEIELIMKIPNVLNDID